MSLFNRKTALDELGLKAHANFINDIVEISTLGLVDDFTGSEGAADAAREGAQLSADATLASTEKNIDFQEWLWGEQKDLLQPFADAGEAAIPSYMDQINKPFTIDDMYLDPGYQYGLNEMTKAYDNTASAKGMQLSGAQVKAQSRHANDYASTKFGEAFSRRQTGLDNLYRMITLGSNAAAGQATQGSNMGTSVSNSINTAGQAEAGMYSDIGNINAANEMSGFNTLMDIGKLGASFS